MWHDCRLAWPVDGAHQLVTVAVIKHGSMRRKRVSVAVFGDDLQWHFIRTRDKASTHLRVLAWQPIPAPYRSPRTLALTHGLVGDSSQSSPKSPT
jgi:hypothetical protein